MTKTFYLNFIIFFFFLTFLRSWRIISKSRREKKKKSVGRRALDKTYRIKYVNERGVICIYSFAYLYTTLNYTVLSYISLFFLLKKKKYCTLFLNIFFMFSFSFFKFFFDSISFVLRRLRLFKLSFFFCLYTRHSSFSL